MKFKVNEHQRGYIPSKTTILKHSEYEEHTKTDTVECLVLATDYPDDPTKTRTKCLDEHLSPPETRFEKKIAVHFMLFQNA